MKIFSPVLIVLMSLLISPASAQDYVKAFNAYSRGDYALAQREFRSLAQRGSVLAQYKLGLMFNNGEGVRRDFGEAVIWFSRAATYGYAPAQRSLGVKYEKGQGVKRSYSEAVRWYRHGADQGDAKAQYRLGRMYVMGRGVRRDYTEAVAWFNLAAAQGIEDAGLARDAVAAKLSPQQLAETERKTLKAQLIEANKQGRRP
jgi:TPR repeat protein